MPSIWAASSGRSSSWSISVPFRVVGSHFGAGHVSLSGLVLCGAVGEPGVAGGRVATADESPGLVLDDFAARVGFVGGCGGVPVRSGVAEGGEGGGVAAALGEP